MFQDASELIPVANGDPVGRMADQSGNGNDLVAGSAPTYQAGVYNGKGCLRFDGLTNYLKSISNLGITGLGAPVTLVFVGKFNDTPGAWNPLIGFGTPSGNGTNFEVETVDGKWMFHGGGSGDVGSSLAIDTDLHVHVLYYDGTNIFWSIDGVPVYDYTMPVALVTAASPIALGANGWDGSGPVPADICEALVFDSQLDSGAQLALTDFLKTKWGIA